MDISPSSADTSCNCLHPWQVWISSTLRPQASNDSSFGGCNSHCLPMEYMSVATLCPKVSKSGLISSKTCLPSIFWETELNIQFHGKIWGNIHCKAVWDKRSQTLLTTTREHSFWCHQLSSNTSLDWGKAPSRRKINTEEKYNFQYTRLEIEMFK